MIEGLNAVKQILGTPPTENIEEPRKENTPTGFLDNENGLFYYDTKVKDYVKICAPLLVVALTRELEDDNAGHLLQFSNRNGTPQQVKIFDAWLAKDGSKIHDVLYKHGFHINTSIKPRIN